MFKTKTVRTNELKLRLGPSVKEGGAVVANIVGLPRVAFSNNEFHHDGIDNNEGED